MEIQEIIDSLSPNEKKVLAKIKECTLDKEILNNLSKKTSLNIISVQRSLEYLQNKSIIKISIEEEKVIDLSVNGLLYRKKGLPERRLLTFLEEKRIIPLEEVQRQSNLSSDEFKAALGVLKHKAMINIKNKKIILECDKKEITKKFLEEQFLESLPLKTNELKPEQSFAYKSLEKRKNIIETKIKKNLIIEITKKGHEILERGIKKEELIEQITIDLLKKEQNWKGKKFRRYDITSPVPKIYGGKKHFINQTIESIKKIFTEMGFVEMTGEIIQSSFWNFDALFTAQDHPVREMQDTFFIEAKSKFPEDKKLIKSIKESHEKGFDNSTGWQYSWEEKEAKRTVLRTHTTALSAQMLSTLKQKDLPKKFFCIGKVFRNETIDWSHLFEFYQTEGIVVDENANFRHLLGYLKQYYEKLGYKKIKFTPAYFPYTEPSVEINVFNQEKGIWLELGGAGIFRPEVTIPLLGKKIPVLAWGQGTDRGAIEYYKIKDLREIYKNNITQLREKKIFLK